MIACHINDPVIGTSQSISGPFPLKSGTVNPKGGIVPGVQKIMHRWLWICLAVQALPAAWLAYYVLMST